ncbi:DUF3846 domain-containing protein [Pseudonocardia sp. RS010]|uniref:DUF3846 domain-containing protein n=1 Tax=Pseudonocardia sp. RS010 TaxID=3385979 RepID=UPI0039A351BD
MTKTAITALKITADGEVTDVEIPAGDFLQTAYAQINCRAVDVVTLTSRLDMWLDDEGLVNGSVLNAPATFLAREYGRTHQSYAGTVLLTEHNAEGDTTSLGPELRQVVLDVLLAV